MESEAGPEMESDQNFAINLAYACVKVRSLKSRVSRTAFMRVSPNASTESATELVSLARFSTGYTEILV